MIDKTTDIKQLSKLWRNLILAQLQLEGEMVLNAKSVKGVDLVKHLEYVNDPISHSDVFVVFEIEGRQSDNNINMTEADATITMYRSFRLQLTFYGDEAYDSASLLKARLETDKCRTELYENGIYYEDTESIEETDEFINETVWERADMLVNFSIMQNVDQASSYADFANLKDVTVIV